MIGNLSFCTVQLNPLEKRRREIGPGEFEMGQKRGKNLSFLNVERNRVSCSTATARGTLLLTAFGGLLSKVRFLLNKPGLKKILFYKIPHPLHNKISFLGR